MNRRVLLKSNTIMIIVIIICFLFMIYTDSASYQELVEQHIESVARMSSSEVKTKIENDLNEPLTVAQDIANNTFLHDWAKEESKNLNNKDYVNNLYNYLHTYQQKYKYTTVFFVSNSTHNYYYQEGYNKTIHEGDDHDVWYYNFVKLNHQYDIQVDTDEVNDNNPTIFVNYRLENNDGEFLGVVGVAVELRDIQELVSSYEEKYGLSISIYNQKGSKTSFAQNTEYFLENQELNALLKNYNIESLTDSKEGVLTWEENGNEQTCLVDIFSSQLQWNILVEKQTQSLTQVFLDKLMSNTLAGLGILITCIFASYFVFNAYQKKIVTLENIDDLTGLPNRKLFQKRFKKSQKKHMNTKQCIFMMDIDFFKNFNDTKGHLFGNTILKFVGTTIKELFADYGMVSRWGGDEFIGIIDADLETSLKLLEELRTTLQQEDPNLTISVGLMELMDGTLVDNMHKVDTALYTAKKQGRNQIVVLENDK